MDTTTTTTTIDGAAQVRKQLSWHWDHQLRGRLDGLSDEEYFWEPVPGCWNLRPRSQSSAPVQAGVGDLVAEFAFPEPDPAPVTTIAWRLAHLLVGIFGMRNATHFGAPPVDYMSAEWPTTAGAALARLDQEYATWMAGVASLDERALAQAVGEAEGPFAGEPMAALVLHMQREVIHHGAEICLLRDLYRAQVSHAG